MSVFEWLQPEAMETTAFWSLVGLSFITSAITAVMGVGGGVMLLAVMANLMPAISIIPVHGAVQLGSNGGRLIAMREYVSWKLVGWFFAGSAVGAIIGGQIVVSLPAHWLKLVLALFILYSVWVPMFKSFGKGRSISVVGGISAFLTMFVGATGPFIISTIKDHFEDRRHLIGTMAALMSIQHGLKAIVFGLFGFAFAEWAGLIALMIATGFLGTLTGKALLERISNERYKPLLKIILTLLALRLLYNGVMTVLSS